MDTVTKATAPARLTDRMVEALSTLAALLDRTINEAKTLDNTFQEKLLQTIHDTEVSLRSQAAAHLEKALTDSEERVRKELTGELKAQFDVDLKAALASVHGQMEEEFLKKAADMSAQWEEERQKLTAEIEAAAEKAKTASAPSGEGPSPVLVQEMERVQGLVANITALIDDPATELSTVIRKNVERAELESYLKGIRFAVGK